MANREELLIIRAARAGKAPAQLALGKRYLFGGGGLPQSHSTALHWLQKAAENNQPDAWLLIGANVPFDVAHQVKDPLRVAFWYERAFDGGIAKAGLVLALLVFSCWTRAEPSLKQKALRALQAAAEAGLPDAQWLLAQQLGIRETARQTKPHDATASEGNQLNAAVEWATRAAKGGVIEAQYVLADSAWESGDYLKFLLWALPLAQDIERRASGLTIRRQPCNKLETELLSRCAQALLKAAAQGNEEAQKLLHKIVPPIRKADWANVAKRAFTREMMSQYPFLAARVELGYWFGLTRAEALLIDVQEADHGHCLEIDIREQHPRSRRRLILILTSEQRQAVDYAARVFDTVDGSPIGAEGNYRQRIYRFRSLMSARREHNRNRA